MSRISFKAYWGIPRLRALQPLGGEQATIPHMKAKHVPYQLMYGP